MHDGRRAAGDAATGLFVASAAACAFAPAVGNDWAYWDDDLFILSNPHIRSFSAENLRWMATAFIGGTYQPLGWLSYALDFKTWGLDPHGFHLTSLALHAVNAVLVYALVLRLLRLSLRARAAGLDGALAAAFGALFYALHPLRVEAVAWASERRQALAVSLVLAGLLAYLESARSRPARRDLWLALSVLLLGLSAAAKAVAMTIPAVLLVLDWHPLRRKAWAEKVPFLLVGGLAAAAGFLASSRAGSFWSVEDYGLLPRFSQAGFNLAFYLRKTVWPSGLSPLYAVPSDILPWEGRFAASWLLVAFLSAFAWRERRRRPGLLAAWLCYAAFLLPFLGLAQTGRQFAADRYADLAAIALSALAGAGALTVARRAGRIPSFAAGAIVLAGLVFATSRQLSVWRDPISLWTRVVEVEPGSPIARDNLGVAYARAGRPADAAREFAKLLKDDPACSGPRAGSDQACSDARLNLYAAQAELGDLDGAIEGLQSLAAEEPGNELARKNLDRALALKASGITPRP